MSMLRRIRDARDEARLRRTGGAEGAEHFRMSGELPGLGDRPACRVSIEMIREPHQDGSRVRLNAHVQANLASVVRAALDAGHARPPDAGPADVEALPRTPRRAVQESISRTGAVVSRGAGRALHYALSQAWVRRVAEPALRYDLNTWVHVTASSASLDAGSSALLPDTAALAPLGIRPGHAGPPSQAEVWSAGDADHHAELSIVRLDKRDLPEEFRAGLGNRPFQLVATIASTRDRG